MKVRIQRRVHLCAGFTLIEMIVSLTLVGIMSSITAVFLQVPMRSYFVSRQRIDLTDNVELSIRHMQRELRQALPNSVRIKPVGGVTYIEFLATRGSARYRTTAGGPGAGVCAGKDDLVPGVADSCFTTFGQFMPISKIQPLSDYVVLGNALGFDAYMAGSADGPNKSRIVAAPVSVGTAPQIETLWRMNNFPLAGAPSPLVYIVSGPVTYACDSVGGHLVRYSGYAIKPAQPTPPGGASSVIASNLLSCTAQSTATSGGTKRALMQDIVSIDIALGNSVPGQIAETRHFMVQAPVSKIP